MTELFSQFTDNLSGLAFDAMKEHYQEKIEESKLRSRIKEYIISQKDYQDICSLSEEFDFSGLIEYLQGSFLSSVKTRIFDPSSKARGTARDEVIDAAIAFAKATTPESQKRVTYLVSQCMDIIRSFYTSGIKIQDYILAEEIVNAVDDNTRAIVNSATTEIKNELHAAVAAGSMFSLDSFVQQAASGNLTQAGRNLRMLFDRMSMEHPLFPYYGYELSNDSLISKPRSQDAVKKYPPKFIFTGKVRTGDRYINDPSMDIMDYAYRHQLIIAMDVEEAKKYLGDVLDPSQEEVRGLPGNVLYAKPPAFPPAFPCSIKVGDEVYFEYLLIRTQEILDDGTIIISNREQDNSHFFFEFSIRPNIGDGGSFKVNTTDLTNREKLLHLKFLNALMHEKKLSIHVLEAGKDLLVSNVSGVDYESGFQSIEEEIDFWERVCVIENRFAVSLDVADSISQEDYELVIYLSDLITEDEVISTWGGAIFTGIIDNRFRENLLGMDETPMAISYVGTCTITLWRTPMTVEFMRTYKMAIIKDLKKTKRKVAALEDGDALKITFVPGSDKTQIDTTRIPASLLQHG